MPRAGGERGRRGAAGVCLALAQDSEGVVDRLVGDLPALAGRHRAVSQLLPSADLLPHRAGGRHCHAYCSQG